MNEEQTQTLSLRAAYAFGAAHGLEREVSEIRDMSSSGIPLTRASVPPTTFPPELKL